MNHQFNALHRITFCPTAKDIKRDAINREEPTCGHLPFGAFDRPGGYKLR